MPNSVIFETGTAMRRRDFIEIVGGAAAVRRERAAARAVVACS